MYILQLMLLSTIISMAYKYRRDWRRIALILASIFLYITFLRWTDY
jgi:hypothetical protein